MARRDGDELLDHARGLISASWTQHAEARDAEGIAINPWEPDAASWSLLGALVSGYERFVWADGQRVALEKLAGACLLLAGVLDSDSLADWNDAPGRTQAEVLAALDEADRRWAVDARGHAL